jgi:hypothetical protein
VVIDARQVNFIDYSGVDMLHREARRLRRWRSLTLHRARPQVMEELQKLEGVECARSGLRSEVDPGAAAHRQAAPTDAP